MRHLGPTLTVAVALFGAACSGSKDTPATARTEPPARVATAVTAQAPAPVIAESDVRAQLDAWLASQNRGDFAAYSALYAERFQGVRRNAERTHAFDRTGWLADRQRMFRRPMVVAANDVAIETTATTAEVRFTQRWTSGTYADEGPKRILFVRGEAGLKIGVEEMLAASRLDDVGAAIALGTFVGLPTHDGPIAVLAGAQPDAATGAPTLLTDEDPFVVSKAASTSVPAGVSALVGRAVTVIERRRACPGTIEAIRVVALVVPHFGIVQHWSGQGEDESGRVVPAAERAVDAWNMATATYYAAAIRSECRDAVAVTLSESSKVVVYTPREPTVPERTALATSFERTRRFTQREADYATFVSESEPSEDYPAPPAQRPAWRTDSSVVVFESGARRVGTVVQNAGGCGGFNVSGWSGFELAGAAATELREPTAIGDYVSVIAVFDVDGDGNLEAIVRRDLASYGLIRIAPTSTLLRRVDVDFLDCPC